MTAELRLERLKDWREGLKAKGLCVWCAKHRTAEGRMVCDVCRVGKHPGRPKNEQKMDLAERYGLSSNERRCLTGSVTAQLVKCKTEEARKLILGIRES